jgi:hypothetical protein
MPNTIPDQKKKKKTKKERSNSSFIRSLIVTYRDVLTQM